MRDDLSKQLCEHERRRSWDSYSNYRNLRVFEDANYLMREDEEPFNGTVGGSSIRESMKQRYNWHYQGKEFSENLSPLYGILQKNVGKFWDKVYSEICAVADRRSVVGNHIFQHLFDYIQTHTFIEGGKIYYSEDRQYRINRGEDPGRVPIERSSCDFYVHPISGCIARNQITRWTNYKAESKRRNDAIAAEQLKTKRVINNEIELRKISNTWFEFKFKLLSKDDLRTAIDVDEAVRIGQVERTQRYGYGRKLISRRTLSHKELKQLKLV